MQAAGWCVEVWQMDEQLVARTGREKQRQSGEGLRLVVGVVPVSRTSSGELRVLLVNSRKHPGEWLLPKGGWEEDEDERECARRECWEEAGVVGELVGREGEGEAEPLLQGVEVRGKSRDQLHTYYGLLVEEMRDDWPEKSERGRQYFSFGEAERVLSVQERRRDREAQCAALKKMRERVDLRLLY